MRQEGGCTQRNCDSRFGYKGQTERFGCKTTHTWTSPPSKRALPSSQPATTCTYPTMASMVDLSSSSVEHQQQQQLEFRYAFGHRRASTVSTSSSISTASATTARRASVASLMVPSRMPLAPLGPQMTPAFALADQSPTTSTTVGGFASFMAKNSPASYPHQHQHQHSSSSSASTSSLLSVNGNINAKRPSPSDDAVVALPYGHSSHVNGATSPMLHLPRCVCSSIRRSSFHFALSFLRALAGHRPSAPYVPFVCLSHAISFPPFLVLSLRSQPIPWNLRSIS